jgi:hypothetical protein
MLEELAALAPQPLTVVLDRDGAYPAMDDLLLELQLARGAMRRGRERQSQTTARPKSPVKIACAGGRSARLETLWAPIYLDEPLRAGFLASPEEFAHSHDLTAEEAAALASIVGQAWRCRYRVSHESGNCERLTNISISRPNLRDPILVSPVRLHAIAVPAPRSD